MTARRRTEPTDTSYLLHKPRHWAGAALGAALTLALVSIVWSARHQNAAETFAPEQMQQRLDQLHAQDRAIFNGKTGAGTSSAPLPPLPQYARSTVHVGSHAPTAPPASDAGWQPSDTPREPMPMLEEGPDIAVQRRLHPSAMFNISGNRNAQPPPTGWQGSGTIQLSGDSGSMPSDAGQQIADAGRAKVDNAQPSAAAQGTGTGTGQGAGGAQGAGGGQTTSGGQNGGGGAASTGGGDSAAPAGDNGQQAGTGTHIPEVIDIQASDMQWDPAHAHLHQGDGELFVYSNSSVDAQFDLNTPGQGLSIFARADKANGAWPTVTVSIDGTPIGTMTVNSTVDKKFYFPISVDPGQVNLQLSYTNDLYDPNAHQDRNLYISHVKVVAQGTQGQ